MGEPAKTNINQHTAGIFRLAGLIVPGVLTLYWWLVDTGRINSTHYAGPVTFVAIIIPWIILALILYFSPTLYVRTIKIRFILYHILGISYILFVSGFTLPFFIFWVFLFVACYFYFSYIGFGLSIVSFIMFLLYEMIRNFGTLSDMIITVFAMAAVLAVGLVVVGIGRSQELGQTELDMSRRREMQQRDRTLTLINNLADAVISTDSKGVIQVYNAAVLNLLDTNTALEGQHIDEILKLRDQKGSSLSLYSLLKGAKSVAVRDDISTTIEEETIRLEVTYSPIRSSYSQHKKQQTDDGYMIIIRDITKAKSLEEERDEFISVVSHELRTPITVTEGTLGNLQVMLERNTLPEKILKKNIDTAHEQVLFLARMVNDLSTLSRAERGIADTEELIDLQTLAEELYSEYGPQAKQKDLVFNLDVTPQPGKVLASQLYLRELLQNFITNSIKYTKEGSVTLRIGKDAHKDILFEVTDTGIGISKSDQVKIFDKFYRSEDYRTRETGGTGLGLYVAAKLAKKLKTHITLTSRLNHGSTFSFTLPDATAGKNSKSL